MATIFASEVSSVWSYPPKFLCRLFFLNRDIYRLMFIFWSWPRPIDFLVNRVEIDIRKPFVKFGPHPMEQNGRIGYHGRCWVYTII